MKLFTYPARLEPAPGPDGTPGFVAYDSAGNVRGWGKSAIDIIAAHYGTTESLEAYQADPDGPDAWVVVRTLKGYRVSIDLAAVVPETAAADKRRRRYMGIATFDTEKAAQDYVPVVEHLLAEAMERGAEGWGIEKWQVWVVQLNRLVREGKPLSDIWIKRPPKPAASSQWLDKFNTRKRKKTANVS